MSPTFLLLSESNSYLTELSIITVATKKYSASFTYVKHSDKPQMGALSAHQLNH